MLQLKQTNQRLDIYSFNQHWVYGFTKDIHQLLHYLSAHDQRILGVFEQTFYIRETTIPEFLKHLELYRYKTINPQSADIVIQKLIKSYYQNYSPEGKTYVGEWSCTKEGFIEYLKQNFKWDTLIDMYYDELDRVLYPR